MFHPAPQNLEELMKPALNEMFLEWDGERLDMYFEDKWFSLSYHDDSEESETDNTYSDDSNYSDNYTDD